MNAYDYTQKNFQARVTTSLSCQQLSARQLVEWRSLSRSAGYFLKFLMVQEFHLIFVPFVYVLRDECFIEYLQFPSFPNPHGRECGSDRLSCQQNREKECECEPFRRHVPKPYLSKHDKVLAAHYAIQSESD